jgi:uncharacterized protein YigE (DUF2233 family)
MAGVASAAEKPAKEPDLANEPAPAILAAGMKAAAVESLAPGVLHRLAKLPEYGLAIHAFVFDPATYTVRVVEQKADTGSPIGAFLDRPGDVFAINGGFFERDDKTTHLAPSGLLVVDGAIVAAEHQRAGSGIVYVANGTLYIVYRKTAPPPSTMDQAIQVGPVLVDPGGKVGIYKNTGDRLDRSAICLAGGRVVFIVVDGGLSLYRLAHLLAAPEKDGGLGCDIALNLDGGPSTQALYRSGGRRIEIPGEWPVENALVVAPRDR